MGDILRLVKNEKNKEANLRCGLCKNCKGMKCSAGFIYSMMDSIRTISGNHSKYVITNGSLLLAKLENKQLPEKELINLMTELMLQCNGCSEHNDNCIISLAMQTVYYSMFGTLDRLNSQSMPLSILLTIKEMDVHIADKIGKNYLSIFNEKSNEKNLYSALS